MKLVPNIRDEFLNAFSSLIRGEYFQKSKKFKQMRLVSWIWFLYILVGFLMGGGAVFIWHFLKNASMKLVWFEWILVILSNITFMLMCQTFIASFQEYEPQAAWLSLVFMGFPVLIMAVVVFRSINKRYIKNQGISEHN